MTDRLTGKVALITGVARGIGAACARRFVAEGARVLLTDVLDEEGAALAESLGEEAEFHHLDVSSEHGWPGAIAAAVERFGGLHVLVNNAGLTIRKKIHEMPTSDFDTVLRVNLYGTFYGTRAAAGPMHESGGGSIVNISSMAAIRAYGEGGAYAASKWGVRGLTKVSALDLAPLGIRVNSVHPGPIATPLLGSLVGEPVEDLERSAGVGTADEVAAVVLFLASDESSFVTGAEHLVDGGASL